MKIHAQAGKRSLDVTIERENGHYVVDIEGVRRIVDAHKLEDDFYSILCGGRSYEVSVEPRANGYWIRHGAAEQWVSFSDPTRRARQTLLPQAGVEKVLSVMPGKVVRLLVVEGQWVDPGDGLLVIEAMKMENEIASQVAGRVDAVAVQPGQTLEAGAVLMVIDGRRKKSEL